MMPSKERVGQIIEMKAATLTLIPLALRLSFILTPRSGLRHTHTWGSLPPDAIASGVLSHSI